MAETMTKAFQWTPEKRAACVLLAEGLRQSAVAERLEIHRENIWRWKQKPEFMAELDRLTSETGLAKRAERLRLLKSNAEGLAAEVARRIKNGELKKMSGRDLFQALSRTLASIDDITKENSHGSLGRAEQVKIEILQQFQSMTPTELEARTKWQQEVLSQVNEDKSEIYPVGLVPAGTGVAENEN